MPKLVQNAFLITLLHHFSILNFKKRQNGQNTRILEKCLEKMWTESVE